MGIRVPFVFLALIVVSGGIAGDARPEGLGGYLETGYTKTDSETVDATGQSMKTKTDTFVQRYNINVEKNFFPALVFSTGGVFEKIDTSLKSGGAETDSTDTKILPFVRLKLRNPLYNAEAAYLLNEEKVKTSGVSPMTTVRETWVSTFQWRPDGLPDVKLDYLRSNNYDKARQVLDVTDDRFGITTQYRPVNPLYLRYQLSVGERNDRLNNTTTEDVFHNGKITYTDQFFKRRISVNSDYTITREEIRTRTGGGGEVEFRLFPIFGLSVFSDVPETMILDSNALLIDGDLTAGAGINLGLPSPGGDARRRNIGLDFVTDTEVNTLLVYVDRDIAQVADSFSWRIYTSADNQNWTLRKTVAPAVYNAFLLRFEIRFSILTSRYIKAVVAPLSPVTPFATNFPTILVTELQAEIKRPSGEVSGKLSSTTHLYNLGIRTQILGSPLLVHELTYFLKKTDSSTTPTTYTLSNGLLFQHQFSKVFSGRARVARENGKDREGSRTAYIYSAALSAVPLDTLRHSLVFSGSDEAGAGNTITTNALFLYNNAKLYEGFDVNLGGGISRTEISPGRKTDQTQITGSTTLVPHPAVTINVIYTESSVSASGGDIPGDTKNDTEAWEGNLALTPLSTLYLFGSYRTESVDQGGVRERRNVSSYVVNWSAFPDGTLHLNFNYSETIRTENNTKERSIIPSLRWNIKARTYLDLSYQNLKNSSVVLSDSIRIVSGTIHVGF